MAEKEHREAPCQGRSPTIEGASREGRCPRWHGEHQRATLGEHPPFDPCQVALLHDDALRVRIPLLGPDRVQIPPMALGLKPGPGQDEAHRTGLEATRPSVTQLELSMP